MEMLYQCLCVLIGLHFPVSLMEWSLYCHDLWLTVCAVLCAGKFLIQCRMKHLPGDRGI